MSPPLRLTAVKFLHSERVHQDLGELNVTPHGVWHFPEVLRIGMRAALTAGRAIA